MFKETKRDMGNCKFIFVEDCMRNKGYAFLVLTILCFGCEQRIINKAILIEQDTQIMCDETAIDRCALPSQIQELADETMDSDTADPVHYISILDIGEDSLLGRIHSIRAAKESIILQTFIWDDDEVGQFIFMEMLKAARRGVKVRMILDQYGCYVRPKVLAAMDTAHENIEIRLYRPPKALIKRTPSLFGESPTAGKIPTSL